MLRFWKRRPLMKPVAPKPKLPTARPESVGEAAARRRLADTDGTLRRMRQTVENNRFL